MRASHVPTWARQRSTAVNETRQAFAESSTACLLGVHGMLLHGLTPAQRHFQGLLEIDRTKGEEVSLWEKPRGHSQLTRVDKRTSSLRKSLMRVHLSQTDNCWEAKSQGIEKMLLRMAVLQLILYIRIKG